jgi:primary-amine oxidase
VGEYGMGFNSHSLKLGCDCKGSIHYLDGVVCNKEGTPEIIKNAICIHEEDVGLLFKHLDFRDGSYIATRGRKLVISQIFTAANYEYCIYWQFFQDGSIQPELKLTGILNTYVLAPDEKAAPWGTEVAPHITAHNHQHIFNLRLNPMIDGIENTVIQNDSMAAEAPVGSDENYYGNAFYCKKTPLTTTDIAQTDYSHETARTWDIVSAKRRHPYSKAPTGYKIVNLQMAKILAKEGSLVWKRAGFARKHLYVTPYEEGRLYPAGKFVPQTYGAQNAANENILDWSKGNQNVSERDIIVWVNFGLNHFPRPEDFPVMPTESCAVLLRPSHFFLKNPALNVPPSTVFSDDTSTYAFADKNDTQHKL